VTVSF